MISKLQIKTLILEVLKKFKVEIKEIILFGSRARGDNTQYSDWDFLLIVKKTISLKRKRTVAKAIRVKLADIYIDCDVVIKSENELDYYKDFIGSITREALKEGIYL